MGYSEQKVRPGWFARNWFWFVPLVVSPFCLCGMCVAMPFFLTGAAILSAVNSTEVYEQSKQKASESPAVQERLGTPIIVKDLSFQGDFSMSNGEGDADITYPITGPNGTGRVHFVATKSSGQEWEFHELTVSFDDGSPDVDLLAEAAELGASEGGSAELPAEATPNGESK